jgi:hypothetical protein
MTTAIRRRYGMTLTETTRLTAGSCTAVATTLVEPLARAITVAVESVDDAIAAPVESLTRH